MYIFRIPTFFEIYKIRKPLWACLVMPILNRMTSLFVALKDMKLHAQNHFYTSIIFWDIKVLKASLGIPDIDDHTHLNLHNPHPPTPTITLIDMKLHAQNQFNVFFGFWDLKVLMNSLFGHAWAWLHIKSHHQFVALIDMYIHCKNPLYTCNSFRDIKV